MNVYITGGHLTPALAVVDELQKKYPAVNIFFVGRQTAQTTTRQPSHERREVEARNVPFLSIEAAKFHRAQAWLNFWEFLKLIPSIRTVLGFFRQNKPDIILSFGGYLSLPVALAGKLYRARLILHEQTKAAGLANQVLSRIADVIAVASEESLIFFPSHKTVVTGNPIRQSLFREYKIPPKWLFAVSAQKPLLYITGGSQGSQVINRTVAGILPKLTRDFVVVHQCGVSLDQHELKELEKERVKLSEELQPRYIVREWIEEKEVSYLFRHARFVISRAGANTVQELILSGTPAIYIPLPFAYNDEQFRNIEVLLDEKASLCILQKDLIPDTLLQKVREIERKYEVYKESMEAERKKLITNGTQRLIRLVIHSAGK